LSVGRSGGHGSAWRHSGGLRIPGWVHASCTRHAFGACNEPLGGAAHEACRGGSSRTGQPDEAGRGTGCSGPGHLPECDGSNQWQDDVLSHAGSLPASGTYVITTACIGTTNARLVLSQRKPGNASGQVDFSEAFACAEPSSRTLDLHAGDVTVDVINLSPDGSTWGTGAFANVRITSWKP